MSGLMIAAPASGSGKTVVTLGLMRALKRRGQTLAPGKAGPDYIDPAFHSAASGETCFNFDPWAMRPDFLLAQAERHGSGRLLLIEAMMGLFDGAADAPFCFGPPIPWREAAALRLALVPPKPAAA